MTPSTTNTAAQAGKSLYDEYSGNHPTIHSNRFPSWSELTQAQRDEWNRKAPESTIPPQAATLTQQQGGEQEVGALVGKWRRLASYEDEEGELEVGSESAVRLIRCADELEAALRTKQPAASEGDVVRSAQHVKNIATMPNEIRSAILEALAAYDPERMARCGNTSKQAAGEAVDDEMVQRGLDAAIEATYARLARYSVVRAILTAALRSKQAAGEAVVLERWGFPSGISSPAERCADGYWTPWHIAQSLLSTPSRHPADEELSKSDKDYILRTQNLLLGFMLDCNAIGAKEAGVNLARSMKEKAAALAGTP